MPTVSVVIPTWNRAALLEATVRSVLAQTYAPLEVLVVDDGSTDATPTVCARFPAPVRCIRQENTGLSGARNRGIREARGDWIALCDSDDLWHPEKLEAQLAALVAAPQAEWCLTGCDLIDPDGLPVELEGPGFLRVFPVFAERGVSVDEHFAAFLQRGEVDAGGRRRTLYHGDAYEMWFAGNVGLPSSALVSRSLVARAGAFDPEFRVAEETEFFHRLAAAAPVAILTDALVSYRVGHASLVNSGDPSPLIRNALRSLERAAALRPDAPTSVARAHAEARRRLRLRLAYARLSLLDRGGARSELIRARADGAPLSPRFLVLLAATLLPAAALRALHGAKRRLRPR